MQSSFPSLWFRLSSSMPHLGFEPCRIKNGRDGKRKKSSYLAGEVVRLFHHNILGIAKCLEVIPSFKSDSLEGIFENIWLPFPSQGQCITWKMMLPQLLFFWWPTSCRLLIHISLPFQVDNWKGLKLIPHWFFLPCGNS